MVTTTEGPEPAKLPPAPLPEGAVKVTLAPLTGAALLSVTVTLSAVPKAVPTVALCGVVPPLAVMLLGGPRKVGQGKGRRGPAIGRRHGIAARFRVRA